MSFYMTYLARWPDYFHVAEAPGKRVMGYMMGKVEGQGESWHGHVTAITLAPEYRRQQLAKKLVNLLEDISDKIRVLWYYFGEEDGLVNVGRRLCWSLPRAGDISEGKMMISSVRSSNVACEKEVELLLPNVYTHE